MGSDWLCPFATTSSAASLSSGQVFRQRCWRLICQKEIPVVASYCLTSLWLAPQYDEECGSCLKRKKLPDCWFIYFHD